MLRPPLSSLFWWAAVVSIGLLTLLFAPLLKRDRLARFWAAGMLFATIPVCATLPMDRLLTFVGFGAFGLLAQFWAFVFDRSNVRRDLSRMANPCVCGRLVFRGRPRGLGTAHFSPAPTSPLGPWWVEDRLYVHAPLGPSVGEKTVVVVNAPSAAHAAYLTVPSAGDWSTHSAAHTSARAGGSRGEHPPPRRAHARNHAAAGLSRSRPGPGFPMRAPAVGPGSGSEADRHDRYGHRPDRRMAGRPSRRFGSTSRSSHPHSSGFAFVATVTSRSISRPLARRLKSSLTGGPSSHRPAASDLG